MKRITSIVAGSFFAVLIASGAVTSKLTAQDEPGEIFSVPFAFTADGHNVVAGTYEFDRLSDPFLISIRNLETGDKQIFTVRPEQQRSVASKGLLVFHRCGQRRDLTEFHVPGTNMYSAAAFPGPAGNPKVESCSHTDTVMVAAR